MLRYNTNLNQVGKRIGGQVRGVKSIVESVPGTLRGARKGITQASERLKSIPTDIKSAPKTRSPEQNGYYRVILREISRMKNNKIGHTEDELHEICKHKFKVESTKHLSVEEFTEYLDLIIIWFAELGFPVQDPRKSIFP